VSRIHKELLKRITEQVNIVSLASEYFDIEKKGEHYRIVAENGHLDSVVLYPETNSFYRYSTSVGGDVIAFVQECGIENISNFRDAVNFLKNKVDPNFKIEKQEKLSTDKMNMVERMYKLKEQLNLEDKAPNVIAYLIKERKIDKQIVFDALDRKLIKQDSTNGYKSVAFMGYNRFGVLSAVAKRSCSANSSFKIELEGCDYTVGWLYPPKNNILDENGKLYCFESYIDMLSYKTFLKQSGLDYEKDCFLSCGSATKYKTILSNVKEYNFKDIVIAFDNDDAGRLYSERASHELIKLGCNVQVHTPKNAKDWNEQLQNQSNNIAIRKNNASIKQEAKSKDESKIHIKDKKIER